ncbi:aminodeoxychorismate/anthranilate synthase component II [Planococcus sp. CP5-4]|uniref:anthranilate synthase component II n=1 Tax=unclassified Planococcus (in: firmicutes) TaxID=2662419 RepID=UPI001C23035C|nr:MULTISPECIES: aminodeoxychorismate/anthranilate synthase component II [unclassified Planococcus (in: firmicutes)]MBU9672537.1 aminodeoxychorismate/anthranilate synthase component II [Planococcus sp. CP5-4_YE]MBV0909587.1 aminodeoxychorismate/anthranilate synthase component II [Planococcus sp. CP5-4_UN]MBW6064317.1 aminodeoxychorismate/anthranilate synthase component II [Planococcus sp. CP5-4]
MILLIDHYDSFTYNIYQAIAALGEEVEVVRYGQLSLDEIRGKQAQAIVLSPGPGHPRDVPESIELIRALHRDVPILGICLGQQLLGEAFGGRVTEAPVIRHGKVSELSHSGTGLFAGMQERVPVMRYHSLAIEKASIPDCFDVQAEALDDGTVMAIKLKEYPVYGLQFHPESIGTPEGTDMMARFVELARESRLHMQQTDRD